MHVAVQAIRALSANEIPDAKRVAMRMYLQLPNAHSRDDLVGRRRISTVLSTKMGPGDRWDLLFSQTEDGQVEISSLSQMSRSRILDSFEVGSCIQCLTTLQEPSSWAYHMLTW